MMSFIICLIVLMILHLLTPFWWWVMAVPLLYGLLFGRSARGSFWTGAAAAGLLWLGAAAYYHLSGSALIAKRMALMMHLGSSWLMVLAAGLLAAVAAGIAGLAGHSVAALFKSKR